MMGKSISVPFSLYFIIGLFFSAQGMEKVNNKIKYPQPKNKWLEKIKRQELVKPAKFPKKNDKNKFSQKRCNQEAKKMSPRILKIKV